MAKNYKAIIWWIIGNVVWGIITFCFNKVIDEPMAIAIVSMCGFLILIVVGFLTIVSRNKPSSEYETMARFVVMGYIAQEYGINPSDLKDLSNPQAMEERAKRLKSERELSAQNKKA
jgi:hypothetical protein